MTKPSVVVENVSKKFGQSLESALKYGIIDTLRRCTGLGKGEKVRKGEFWALNDVSFSLAPGDALGIMGVNGSGKTTLLRILNGTYAPDSGKVTLRGRVGALIAAGAGFSPMLTGRENVFISGALLGMSSREVRRRFDEIVAFSELEEFIDMPVRNYSSGMAVRLGFAVAVLGAPDILLVDEVLAVGDLNFQKKCFDRIHALRDNGTTILLVSHSIGAIWSVCNKGILLHHGKALIIGNTEQVCKSYDDHNSLAATQAKQKYTTDTSLATTHGHSRGGTGEAICTCVRILNSANQEATTFKFGEPITFEYHYRVNQRIMKPIFRASLDSPHYKFFVSFDSYEQKMTLPCIDPGEYTLRYSVKDMKLRPGSYSLNTSICAREIGTHIFYWLAATQFAILHDENFFLYSNDHAAIFAEAPMEIIKC
ncbi:ABC transporter ATP-binding protein [Nitratidesulfovibrio liaohensis]|uniref:ABC transporter ATP-binding protein n=1 Tax=Nitratidesulfovibrio liaohensis TaxID=2604158 RepID=A0ABY9QZY5_9BACT|nr:ABC transporter ATP-binding protein [Nitratidesulfovibrio liaohensis]WMW65049.1 ABC transporter ATP-binding protein [Nitratidesulfovibrio liaohensis]